MSGHFNVSGAFRAVLFGLTLGLSNEAAHFVAHAPQPHTDQHEKIEHKALRLREAEAVRSLPRAVAVGTGHRPPLMGDIASRFGMTLYRPV